MRTEMKYERAQHNTFNQPALTFELVKQYRLRSLMSLNRGRSPVNKVDSLKMSIARHEEYLQKDRPDLQAPHEKVTLSALTTLKEFISELEHENPGMDPAILIKNLFVMVRNEPVPGPIQGVLEELLRTTETQRSKDKLLRIRTWFNQLQMWARRPYPARVLRFCGYTFGCAVILVLITLLGIVDPRVNDAQSAIKAIFHPS